VSLKEGNGMGLINIQKIPTVEEILADMPLDSQLRARKEKRDSEIQQIFQGTSKKYLIIIGPCSADNEESVCEYTRRLADLQYKVQDQLVLVPRIYTNKPRTTGKGYKGMAHQPDPGEEPNIVQGLKAIRNLHVRVLRETGLSAADEMLYPGNYPYLEDVLSYVAVGARSVENQEHRLTASGLTVPVGMKNPTSGDLNVMLNAVQAAHMAHVFIYNGWQVKTSGNSFTHCILRGSVNQYGQSIPNYHYEDLIRTAQMYQERGCDYPTIIVDTNHANSNKQFFQQPRIAHEIMHSIKTCELLRGIVKGLMIESYLEEGCQDAPGKEFGKSITDACLGWDDSERLVLDLADIVSKL